MNVRCPHCSTGYQLPDHLLGPRGARVRCPKCAKSFEVARTADSPESAPEDALESNLPLTPSESDEALGLPPLVEVPDEEPEEVATRILDALAARLGERLEVSHAEGRLWADHGEALMRAWDEYREVLGARADAAVFRSHLRARWNVDLGPGPLTGRERAS